jgi:hypothetical protein
VLNDEEQRLAEAMSLEPLSFDHAERMEQLRLIAAGEGLLMDNCPECGISLDGIDIAAHASNHWPPYIDPNHLSREAKQRQRAMLTAARKQRLPVAPAEDET